MSTTGAASSPPTLQHICPPSGHCRPKLITRRYDPVNGNTDYTLACEWHGEVMELKCNSRLHPSAAQEALKRSWAAHVVSVALTEELKPAAARDSEDWYTTYGR